MTPVFRPSEGHDAEVLATLFQEMQAHYAVPCPPRAAIVADLADLPPGNRVLVAEVDGVLAGFAAFAVIYPGPGLRKGLFLKELYVGTNWRGRRLGRGLIGALAALAVAEGHGRIDWTADRDDAGLLDFYDSLGGRRETSKLFYRLTGEALAEIAAKAE
jgi:GNAT superfamily N-acetyltransferase